MRIVLIGDGKMGALVAEVARQRHLEVVDRFTGARPLRADDAVRQALTSLGVTAQRMESTGRGGSEPLVPHGDVVNRSIFRVGDK